MRVLNFWPVKVLGIALLCLSLVACKNEAPGQQPSTAKQAGAAPTLSAEQRAQLKQNYAVTPFKVLSIAELSFDNAPAIAVTFSSPLDPTSQWRNALTIAQPGKNPPSGDWILGDTFTTVYFPFITPNTHYKVAVNTGITSITGRQLQAAFNKNVTTRNKQQSVKFASYGTQLSPSLAEGLTVEAVNVEAVDIDFFKIRPSQLGAFLAREMGNGVYELQSIKDYGDLAYSARFDLNFAKNKRLKSVIPLTQLKPLKEPGVYFAVMREAGKYDYQYQTTWFTLGDIGLQVRQFEQQMVAFTHHAITTKPAPGVTITVFDRQAIQLAEGTTSSEGLATFNSLSRRNTSAPHFAIAQKGEHFSVLKLQTPAMDLSEYRLPARAQKPLELFLYSPRNLYRPGETVHINGLLRDNDARLAGNPTINGSFVMPDGRVYQSVQWAGDDQAFYSHSLPLPKDAVRGEWQFRAKLGNGDIFNYAFNVEDFLPERMKLQLQSPAGTHLSQQSDISIAIQGDYLYGAPAAGNRIEASVHASAARTLFEQWDGFVFGAEDYRGFNGTTELPTAALDANGHANLTLPKEWQGATQPLKLVTRVSLFETGGRPVSRAITQYVWPREQLIGIRPTWATQVAAPNTQAIVELIQVDKQGQQSAAEEVDVLVIRENQQYYWEWNNGWHSNQNTQATPVFNRVVNLPANERTPIAIPVEYGHYRMEVRNKNQDLLASYRFYAGWSWDKPTQGETGRPDKIELAWGANAYAANSQAQLSFQAPYAGTALVTVESNQLLWHKTVPVTAGTNAVTIPVAPDWHRHDIYTSVNLLRAGQNNSQNQAMPKRALGLIHLPLARHAQQLQLSVQAPAKALPATQVSAIVQINNHTALNTKDGPVHLTLSAVDSGVLSLSDFKTPKPFEWFFEPRAYGTELRDTWASFIEQLSDVRARQRFGGDADDQLARGGEAPQTDVQVVQLYSGKIQLDANGRAEIPLDLPYFNGELRLMAVAWSNNRFGHLEAKMKVAAPLIAEVSTPRFLALNDQANATFDVQNLTDVQQKIAVNVQSSKELGSKQVLANITLQPQQKHTLQLPVQAKQSSGMGELTLAISQAPADKTAGQPALDVNRRWHIGLRPAYPAIAIQTDEVINANTRFTAPSYSKPPFEIPQQQMRLTVSPQPPLNLAEHLNQLMQYPYGCLEQTTSRLWPLLVSTQAELERYTGNTGSVRQQSLITQRPAAVKAALGRIASMERGDGSFGLWNNQSNEEHWLTAYATHALLTAKEQGYTVDDALLNRALQRLRAYVTTQGKLWSESQRYSSWPDHYHLAYRAYAALVLARKQQVTLSELRTLYDGYAKQAKTPLPLAQLALALELTGDVRRAKEAWAAALSNSPRPQGYAGDYGTPVRDLAWVSTLALQSQLVNNPLQGLMALRDQLLDSRWLSTQDRWALFNLGHNLEANALPAWQLELTTNGQAAAPQTLSQGFSQMWQGEQVPATLNIDNPNAQPLFVSLQYSGYPTEAPAPVSDGINVTRVFYNLQGEPININQVTSGDLILVRLDISTAKLRIPDALVVDLLPAGFELENQNLASAVKMQDIQVQGKTVAQWLDGSSIVHEEYRDDRYVAAIQLSRKVSQIFYLARAVTPGRYTVPPTLIEDMYRPWLRAVGQSEGQVEVLAK